MRVNGHESLLLENPVQPHAQDVAALDPAEEQKRCHDGRRGRTRVRLFHQLRGQRRGQRHAFSGPCMPPATPESPAHVLFTLLF